MKPSLQGYRTGKIRIGIPSHASSLLELMSARAGNAPSNGTVEVLVLSRELDSYNANELPGILFISCQQPCDNGLDCIQVLKKKHPWLKVIAFTTEPGQCDGIQLLKAGCNSLIDVNHLDQLHEILVLVDEGGLFFPSPVAADLLRYVNKSGHPQCPVSLTAREQLLLQNICRGLSSTEIADLMNKSPRTVEKYRNDLYTKFNVSSKEQLISQAFRWSIV